MRHNKIDPYGCFGHEFGGIWEGMDDWAIVWPTERENLILQTIKFRL
ncbi:hypothetical protein LEP1GSC202_2068 [Leptospira yanagawae serovar Saopaulo str. Sao Paulo = ATCC 700523]|uniref:Uncharacterized protein n=1 Tax=Leptospira yanagawae serovar Saopaulo str. Sao Paulo = ATCC 700523 TaxID=1249483 RepID=A0A5E8HAH3_9LEPT|nr:hypothetical protein [Leptospira yanagawae]EOQ87842.1 hypothetical protein LEP1GSC202_2068 [Leptospira yanagawae serovar Saopaulo str. Sao Paulo = ATCC 700523]